MTTIRIPVELRDRLKARSDGRYNPIWKVVEDLLNAGVEADADLGRIETLERNVDMLFEADVRTNIRIDNIQMPPKGDIQLDEFGVEI